jgi:hypothetical protein
MKKAKCKEKNFETIIAIKIYLDLLGDPYPLSKYTSSFSNEDPKAELDEGLTGVALLLSGLGLGLRLGIELVLGRSSISLGLG